MNNPENYSLSRKFKVYKAHPHKLQKRIIFKNCQLTLKNMSKGGSATKFMLNTLLAKINL